MPNKTIYVKDSDIALWERVQKELGESVSSLFADCMKQRLEEAQSQPNTEGMGKITLSISGEDGAGAVKKSFIGRWLVGDVESGEKPFEDLPLGVSWQSDVCFSVAQTQKGRIVVYQTSTEDESGTMTVYQNFAEMKSHTDTFGNPHYAENILALTAEALGQVYEIELDI